MNYYDIVSKEKSLAIEFEGGTLTVIYDRTFFTRKNADPKKGELQRDYNIRMLVGCLKDWDLCFGADKAEISEETFRDRLLDSFTDYIWKKIAEDSENFTKRV